MIITIFDIFAIFILSNFLIGIMSEKVTILSSIQKMLADLIYINSIIATELIKIIENTTKN